MHLLYGRFWHKVFFDLGLVHTKEPFQKLLNPGMVLGYSYRYYDDNLSDDPAAQPGPILCHQYTALRVINAIGQRLPRIVPIYLHNIHTQRRRRLRAHRVDFGQAGVALQHADRLRSLTWKNKSDFTHLLPRYWC
mgnify:CR=1 FL=1